MKQMLDLRQVREAAHLKVQDKNGRLKFAADRVSHSFLQTVSARGPSSRFAQAEVSRCAGCGCQSSVRNRSCQRRQSEVLLKVRACWHR